MTIQKTYHVEYAHRLDRHPRGCKNLHGHSGKVTVVLGGVVMSETSMVKDFGELKWLGELIDRFDHCLLLQHNDPVRVWLQKGIDEKQIPELDMFTFTGRPTAEECVSYLGKQIRKYLTKHNEGYTRHPLILKSIAFEETTGNEAKQEY